LSRPAWQHLAWIAAALLMAALVGTLFEGGEAMTVGRRAATLDMLPTRLGAAILPHADTATLQVMPAGFVAAAGPGTALALGLEPADDTGDAGLTRLFDLPAEPLPSLIQRERNATLAVAAAAPLSRGPPRLRNAEALLALGLGAEAQALTVLAMRDDPRIAEDPTAHALRGAAALLAGRLAEADGLLRNWPQVASGVHKHHGYAFQWFGLCALIVILYVWFQIISPFRNTRKQSGSL
jgi:hypothetical protein